ncbi:AraC family transcriptional regulator [Paenibacillus hexagrammi]|uniref:AraC family transcriptional regulator n=1 Tax=Paenibacillus hexagrammi TaxID=2908839 RepID=A0ABY3SNT7_9BACL|nr:AraC family transcriptional regulator [Paenibacillus sp. YPD9-1]UJF34795.1 AraC family transcriptional regulator [Paenibacillus sp. YPD9-1]
MIEYLQKSKHHTELHLTQFGIESCIPRHFHGPAVRDYYLLHYILEGRGSFEVGGTTYTLGKGQGFLICPGVVTYYEADASHPWTYCWVGFNGTLAEWLLKQAGLTLSSPILHYNSDDRLYRYIQMMDDSKKDFPRSRESRLNGLLYLMLSELVESGPVEPNSPKSVRSEVYVEKVLDLIEVNYAQKITMEDIAHAIGLNRSYLCSLFKQRMNTSIQDYLIRCRINKACEMMGNAELSIGDISRSVGYNDPLLFSKMFKKVKGLSPKHYRTELQTEAGD